MEHGFEGMVYTLGRDDNAAQNVWGPRGGGN